MILIYSLIFATFVSLILTSNIKRKYSYYYGFSIIIAVSTTIYEVLKMTSDAKLYGLLFYFEKASIKGIVSISFFVLVMFAGALNTKWLITRKLLSIRAELAIIGSILMLPHGMVYIFRFVKYSLPNINSNKTLPIAYLSFIIIGTIAFIIMMPLFITSFKGIRNKIKGKCWKNLQRWAYFFYFLAYSHVLIILLNSKHTDWIKLSTYSTIFGFYTVLRLIKYHNYKQNKLSFNNIQIDKKINDIIINA